MKILSSYPIFVPSIAVLGQTPYVTYIFLPLYHFSFHINQFSTLKMEAVYFSKMSGHLTTTWLKNQKKTLI
jgi:hypothetical protein